MSIVRIKSRRLVGRYGIREEDLPDLHQKWIATLLRTPDYQDATNPFYSTHIGRLVDQLVVDEVRFRKAAKRSCAAQTCPIDAETEDTLDADEYFDASVDVRHQVTVGLDVEAFLQTLAPDLRTLAQGLKEHRMEHLPALLGISRRTAFRRLTELREAAQRYFQRP